jgi:phospholipid/cholesterol/gamma-HCH transport system ATP-binding protein
MRAKGSPIWEIGQMDVNVTEDPPGEPEEHGQLREMSEPGQTVSPDNGSSSLGQAPAIEFRHVSVSFEGKRVLTDVSFQLAPGQMIVVTGASNSGKSVLLHLAIGLLKPDDGEVLVEGVEIGKLDESELLALRSLRMGIAFQDDTLFTGLSTFDNAAYRLVEHNWSETDIERSVDEILHFVGLENDMEKLPEELSIGMRRRLEIARALAGWPRVMLFDEPTSGLDPINARMVLDLIIRARDLRGISAIVATKEMHQIHYLAAHRGAPGPEGANPEGAVIVDGGAKSQLDEIRVMLLHEGQIAFCGTADEFNSSALPAVQNMTDPGHERRESAVKPWG